MNDDKPWAFTCKTCASHNLNVFRFWRILAGPDSESWQEWGHSLRIIAGTLNSRKS